jgi:Zn-finger domain-containing protein
MTNTNRLSNYEAIRRRRRDTIFGNNIIQVNSDSEEEETQINENIDRINHMITRLRGMLAVEYGRRERIRVRRAVRRREQAIRNEQIQYLPTYEEAVINHERSRNHILNNTILNEISDNDSDEDLMNLPSAEEVLSGVINNNNNNTQTTNNTTNETRSRFFNTNH